jgi:hypothetical protein
MRKAVAKVQRGEGGGGLGVSAACRALAAAVAADVAQRRERWAAGEGAAVRW